MGSQIRQARKENYMTQKELAKLVYLRQAAISDIENGKREVSTSELLLFCVGLGKSPDYFYPPGDASLIFRTDVNEDEAELLAITRRLYKDDIERLILIARSFKDDIYRRSPD